jgi:UDP-3-O-[3-hydroxymyristoyl] N-acetylglucosamine deacetylase
MGSPSLPLRVSGRGVHTGAPGAVCFSLREDEGGPRFFLPGRPSPLTSKEIAALPRRAHRSTVIGGGDGDGDAAWRTPEHLLAALLFFADLPLDIRCEGTELPIMDGSALPFRDALARLLAAPGAKLRPDGAPAARRAARAPFWREYDCDLRWETSWDGGFLRVVPARNFSVTFEMDRPPLRRSYRLDSAAQAWTEILPARTFIFHREWRDALAAGPGLMQGAGIDSGLLLAETPEEFAECLRVHPEWTPGPYPLLNQPAWRMPDEPVKHKILDLLGDLAIAGLALPRLDIQVRNGGHRWNHLLLEKLAGY